MKIAVYVDEDGMVASAYGQGRILLYDNAGGDWAVDREVAFALNPDMRLSEVRAAVRGLAARLAGCACFLSTEVRGVVHAILQEEFGFHTWKSEGALGTQLDAVAAKEAELAAAPPPPPPTRLEGAGCGCQGGGGGPRLKRSLSPGETVSSPALEQVGEGHYRVDLVSALAGDSGLNSRMILIPILEGSSFSRLEIVCDHVPRWFPEAVADMDLRAEYTDTAQGVTVDVYLE